jgi:hypothetical protein
MVRGTSATTGGDHGDDGDGDGITGDTNIDNFFEQIEAIIDTRMESYISAVQNGIPNWYVGNATLVSRDGIPVGLQIGPHCFPIDGNIEAFSRLSEDTRIGFFTDEGGFRQISFDDVGDYQYCHATNMGDDIIVICRN